MPVEVLFDGIRSGAAVGDLLAEPNHRAVGVIERQLFSAGNAEAMVPSAGVAIRAQDHQAMQYREIDRSLDVEAEPSTDKQGTDHLGAAGPRHSRPNTRSGPMLTRRTSASSPR